MNNENPIQNILLKIVLIFFIGLAFFIGKIVLEIVNENNSDKSSPKDDLVISFFKGILYIIVGLLILWLFAKVGTAIFGPPEEFIDHGRLK